MTRHILIVSLAAFFISCGKDNEGDKVQLLPGKAILVFPENISECVEGNIISDTQSEVLFQWKPSENTDRYELQLTQLITKKSTSHTTKNTELPIAIDKAAPYSWKIVAINGTNTQESDTWSFYNAGDRPQYFIPFPATLIAPSLSTIFPSSQSTVVLEWKGSDLDGDILEYDIYFDDSDPPAIYRENHKQSTLSDVPLAAGKQYFWKIVTRDSLGNESTSGVFSFEVGS